MRTRAQNTRDAALRRLTRVNHSLALAAVVGAGVVTDVVANIPLGHAKTIATTTGETSGTGHLTLLTSPQTSPLRKPRSHRLRAATHHHRSSAVSSAAASPPAASGSDDSSQSQQSNPAPSAAQQSPQPAVQQTPQPAPQPAPQPTVVAVSGGS